MYNMKKYLEAVQNILNYECGSYLCLFCEMGLSQPQRSHFEEGVQISAKNRTVLCISTPYISVIRWVKQTSRPFP